MESKESIINNIVKKLCDNEINSNLQIELQSPLDNVNNIQKVIIVNVNEKNKGKVLSFVLKALGKCIYRNYFVNCYHNELILYSTIFPQFVRKNSKYVIAKCLDAKPNDLNEIGVTPTYIALENLCENGFKMSLRSDTLKHTELLYALSALGQFHGDCYSFKMLTPNKYNEVLSKLVELHSGHEEDEYHESWLIWREVLFYYCIENFASTCSDIRLKEKAKYLLEILDTVGLLKSMEHISKPNEPLSVLCHGDINRSNIMFKYDHNNEPISCAFVDFQLSSISSPAKDLFSLIFLNVKNSKERRTIWNDIWRTYWEALVDRISKNTMGTATGLPLEFSVTSLQKDFSYNCYAYLPNVISYVYSYFGNKKHANIHKEHVEVKKQFIKKNAIYISEMKSKTITTFDYNFFLNIVEYIENMEVKVQISELLEEYFTHYYCQYPLSMFDNN